MTDMVQLASERVVLKKVATTNGGEWAGPCPGCGGSDRFRVWPVDRGGRGSFWCRGCGRSGDDVQFLVEFTGMGYKEAFAACGREQMLDGYRPAAYRAVTGGTGREPDRFEPRTYDPPVETWQIKAGAFADAAHQALLHNDDALRYLAGRGLDFQAVKGFRLGWFDGEAGKPCLFRPRVAWGLPRMHNPKTGRDKMLWIPRGLVIPTYKAGHLYRIRIRRPAEDLKTDRDVKYYVVPGSGMDLAGHNPDHRVFVIVEADLDEMLIARRAGSMAGSIALGSASAKPGAGMYWHLQKAVRLLIALDLGDDNLAGERAAAWWLDQFPQAKRWPVPRGKDPGEAFEKGVDIKAWVRAGLPPSVTMELAQDHTYLPPADVPPICELRELLRTYPVRITATPDKAEIEFDPGLKNRGIRNRIKELFMGDDEVHWYLRVYHPGDVITGDTFLMPGEEPSHAEAAHDG